nr:HNH endonuclease [Micromonospora chokoriensis]
MGQEELAQSDLEAAVHGQATRWAQKYPDIDEPLTERLLTAVARVGQHRFARNVLKNNGHRCTLCGLGARAGELIAHRMLVASHIKPWRVSSPRERLDPRNGIAACPTHDVAFDTGLLTVDHHLRIHVHPEVQAAAEIDSPMRSSFGRPPLSQHLLLPAGSVPPSRRYLDWHYRHVYQQPQGPASGSSTR